MKFIKIVFITLIIAVSTLSMNAQNQKVGHINSTELLTLMPETQQIKTQLDAYIKELDAQASALTQEYQSFVAALEPQLQTMSDLIKETKLKELQDKERRIQEFQYSAQQKVQQKELELYQPLEKKALDAINAVADRQGYAYVINSASLVYIGTSSIDILPMVKAQLGIQ